jgi:hypothetical protein
MIASWSSSLRDSYHDPNSSVYSTSHTFISLTDISRGDQLTGVPLSHATGANLFSVAAHGPIPMAADSPPERISELDRPAVVESDLPGTIVRSRTSHFDGELIATYAPKPEAPPECA